MRTVEQKPPHQRNGGKLNEKIDTTVMSVNIKTGKIREQSFKSIRICQPKPLKLTN